MSGYHWNCAISSQTLFSHSAKFDRELLLTFHTNVKRLYLLMRVGFKKMAHVFSENNNPIYFLIAFSLSHFKLKRSLCSFCPRRIRIIGTDCKFSTKQLALCTFATRQKFASQQTWSLWSAGCSQAAICVNAWSPPDLQVYTHFYFNIGFYFGRARVLVTWLPLRHIQLVSLQKQWCARDPCSYFRSLWSLF